MNRFPTVLRVTTYSVTSEDDRRESRVASTQPDTVRKVCHPFHLRLKDTSGFSVSSPVSLVSAGYASIAMGLFTAFRPTPLLVGVLAYQYRQVSPEINVNRVVLFCVLFTWIGVVMSVLFVLGIILAASTRIYRRWPLMLHPWGLLFLYFDIVIWISLTVWLHLAVLAHPEYEAEMFDKIHHPKVFFTIIYVESVILGALHYLYATFFIVAELTMIEKFF